MALFICPFDTDHGEQGSKEGLSNHITTAHPDLAGGGITPIPSMPDDHIITVAPPLDALPSTTPTPVPIIAKKAEKKATTEIKLTYKYEGICEDCSNPVTTLLVNPETSDKADKITTVAFCLMCQKQLKTKKVPVL